MRLKSWISKAYMRLSPDYPMPSKEATSLFLKAVLFYHFRNFCLHYDDKEVHKPSFLTFRILHTKKLIFSLAIFDLWLMILKVDHFWYLKLWTLSPAHFVSLMLGFDENSCSQPVSERQNAMSTRLLNGKQNISNKQKG